MPAKSRDPWIDNAKFVVLALVVFGHFLETYRDSNNTVRLVYNAIYLFHMPSIVFLLGMFSRPAKTRAAKLNILYQSVVLYLIAQAVMIVIAALIQDEPLPYKWFEPSLWFKPQFGLWFLLAMGAWRGSLAFIPRAWWIVPLSCLVAVVAGNIDVINRLFSLSRILVFAPFFLCGYCYGDQIITFLRAFRHRTGAISMAFAMIASALAFAPETATLMLQGAVPFSKMNLENAWLWRGVYLGLAAVGTASLLILVPKNDVFFTPLGERTLTLYLFHLPLVRVAPVLIFPKLISPFAIVLIFGFTIFAIWAFTNAHFAKFVRPILTPNMTAK